MNFLIGLNNLRSLSEPKLQLQLFQEIGLLGLIDGVEINADLNDPLEVVRLCEYAELLNDKEKIVQLHAPHGFSHAYNDLYTLTKHLHIYGQLADKINQKISITIHPVEDDTLESAQYKTMMLLSKLKAIKSIYHYNLEFNLENLVSPRLGIKELEPILNKFDTNFCWDIGHDVMNKCCDYTLSDKVKSKLNNIHIHDVDKKDHHPFNYGKTDYIKSVQYLRSINYQGSIVVEIHYPYLKGNSWHDKFNDYLNQVARVKNAYDMIFLEDIRASI